MSAVREIVGIGAEEAAHQLPPPQKNDQLGKCAYVGKKIRERNSNAYKTYMYDNSKIRQVICNVAKTFDPLKKFCLKNCFLFVGQYAPNFSLPYAYMREVTFRQSALPGTLYINSLSATSMFKLLRHD